VKYVVAMNEERTQKNTNRAPKDNKEEGRRKEGS
jgi:hypothetical protein